MKAGMITKKFGADFDSPGGALTLDVSQVSDSDPQGGVHEKTHSDGWKISGMVHEDYYTWVNDFEAVHPILGKVWGNFEKEVHADSEAAFADFYSHHSPSAWDYWDI